MLRDLKFLRRNSGKNLNLEEVENVPVNHRDSMASLLVTDSTSSRPPFCTIQEPFSKLKGGTDQDVSGKSGKIDRTPTKPKFTSTLPRRTPEKQTKNQFGWAQKSDSCSSNATEINDEIRSDMRAIINSVTPRSIKTDYRRANSDCHSTQSTPTKSVSKPPNPVQCLTGGGSRPLASGGVRLPNFGALSKGVPVSCNPVTVVNTVEVPHFELKEDPSFWLEHNVQVLIRIRPLNNTEKSTYGYNRCLKQESSQCITWIGQPEARFTFDHVACETIDQETLFRMVGLPLVENCLSGYNSCMFAYGQTGSGKTYTMLGDIEHLEIKPSSNRGMTPRIFEFLFARIRAEEESRKDEHLRYHCKCSFLEIYNEQITDLLDPSSTNLSLREDNNKRVYVENLSEFDVQTVADVLKLLRLGSSNRKVAATNMNRESSRSHSVFTCVVECEWEKDSTSNFRFARLNLVDLAGSERQKTSGAEGDRLKEAANINKSLSSLGHVIMVLVDVANGRPKHVPYRDSRLTFLLQDSLGGNSKTMIIANVSPSIYSAAETLNTLKFAQRAKLIQNNAFVNEDSSGDVLTLKNQIQLLKDELSLLKRQNVARTLSFGSKASSGIEEQDEHSCRRIAADETEDCAYTNGNECRSSFMLSTRQLKSLEITLAGALRREKMTETSIKQLEAEIEQLNRLVHQREEDSRCTKMMLKFREDKIQRMESLIGGVIPFDDYLKEENNALNTEIQLLQAKLEKNPEVTRFALENIRLLEQLRRFQDFYQEGEREMLLSEISELRDQLFLFLDGRLKQFNHPDAKSVPEEVINITKENDSLKLELKKTLSELEECRSKLSSCVENNTKLQWDIEELRAFMTRTSSSIHDHSSTAEVIKEPISEAPYLNNHTVSDSMEEKNEPWNKDFNLHPEENLHIQVELDILKAILTEERSCRSDMEKNSKSLSLKLELSQKQCESIQKQLDEAKLVIDALESQQILAINEIEDLKNSNSHYVEVLQNKELELSYFKKTKVRESRNQENGGSSPLQENLNKMHKSLEKAKRLNQRYRTNKVFQESNEEEMEEVRRQVEAETAEVIVCLQEELAILQHEFHSKETETSTNLVNSQAEIKRMEEQIFTLNQENMNLSERLRDKEEESRKLSEEWEMLTSEVEAVLVNGHESLDDASDQLEIISNSYPRKRGWIFEQVGKMTKNIIEKDLSIEELNQCLEDVFKKKTEMECMLRSLKGAATVMTEAHQEESKEKDYKITLLTSQLADEKSIVSNLKNTINNRENRLREITTCTTAVSVALSWLSELNDQYINERNALVLKLAEKDTFIEKQGLETEKHNQSFQSEIEGLQMQIYEEKMHGNALKKQIEEHEEAEIKKTEEKLTELKNGVSAVKSCMRDYTDEIGDTKTGFEKREAPSCMKSLEHRTDIDNREDRNESNCIMGGSIRRDVTINLLKKEIESALESLKDVQAEMAKSQNEKDILRTSETESRRCIESVTSQGFGLQIAMDRFEAELKTKMEGLDLKLKGFEEFVHYSSTTSLFQKEFLEAELSDAKVVAVQKVTEATCVAKFEEVQGTLKEADIMINELVIANKALKRDVKKIKEQEILSMKNCNVLNEEVKTLQSMIDLKDQCNQELEKQIELDTETMKYFVQEMETMVSQVMNTSVEEDFASLDSVKSQFYGAMKLMKSCLEDIWSEIIVKDSALSVLHLCHIGILLETVTGLNTENSFLHRGVDESNEVISELREHNFRSKRELERCRTLEGKLLVDIKNGFDRISNQEHETREVSVKLNAFEQKILDLQLQEELMLQRSNSMGSELSALMRDFDISNNNVLSSLLDQERLLNEKDDIFNSKEDNFVMDLFARDFELLIMSCKVKELGDVQENMKKIHEVAEYFKKETILCSIDAWINESLNSLISQDLEEKKIESESLLTRVEDLDVENQILRANICALESDLDKTKTELHDVQVSKSTVVNDLQLKEQEKQIQTNERLRNELQEKGECLNALSLHLTKCVDSVEHIRVNFLTEDSKYTDTLLKEIHVEFERIVQFMDDFEQVEKLAKELASETVTLQTELFRKDEILNGLLFDMRLLQESASNSKDNKDVTESLNASVRVLDEELKSKSICLEEAITKSLKAESELHERTRTLSFLESDIAKERETVRFLSTKTFDLTESKREVEEAKEAIEEELKDERLVNESLEKEIAEMSRTLNETSVTVKLLENSLNNVTDERDDLHEKLLTITKEFEIERDLAEEKEGQLTEAQEEIESIKFQFENKEEEVKLLERSIQELECTVNALENKVDILKEEAEKQRLEREELETEVEAVKQQMNYVQICDADVKRKLMDKEKNLQENLKRVEFLEIELAERDIEIARCKSHISEVNLHAEAQASEYKQKFKALEAMLEQVKQDMPSAIHGSNSSANKLEKTSSKSRGSGSPFKCIGLGLVQQMKSEKEEELNAGRHRLEELETLANNRQKEIFMLNARLATAESMTHDVIRDLLGVKLDMNSCASLLDTQELRILTQKTQNKDVEAQFKEEEIDMLKQQLIAFNMEKKGWLEEIERKQAELIAAQVMLETLRQRDQMLQTQNEMIKMENVTHKKRAMELETEVKRLSGQQNIQQRIHHHAKIKEENNNLKNQNEELGVKLRKTEAYLTRVKEELAKYRASSGKNTCIDSDEEERLSKKLKETEGERLQLAHQLVSLCTSILKAAGITRSASEVNPAVAEEAIDVLKLRINKLETELQDAKQKNRMNKEKELDRRR